MNKLKVGIFGITGCAGCLLSILYEDVFLDLVHLLDIKSYPLVKEERYKGDFDIVFLEGTVTYEEDIKILKKIRKRTKILVALGTCSSLGGVPTIRNFFDKDRLKHVIYPRMGDLSKIKPKPIDKYVKVDYYILECPPNKREIGDFIKQILVGKKPRLNNNPVCMECRLRENLCLLEINEPCLGPVTRGGCDAICPTNKIGCYGCRGKLEDANMEKQIGLLNEKGYNLDEIKKRMEVFSGIEFIENEQINQTRSFGKGRGAC
ncbi:MAG: NADH:ubiquinone oxidoreductase [Nanoarchaeota archaeon]|nr:NADH:ubiquinone oxidoreductase [Nanoarchaeota archaeon]